MEPVVKHEWRVLAANSISPTRETYSDKRSDLLPSSVKDIKTAILNFSTQHEHAGGA